MISTHQWTMSSSYRLDADAPSASPNARSSSPVNYVSDDENQVRSIASQWQIMTFKKNIHFASWYMPWRPLRTHSWIWKAPKYSKFKSRLVNQCGWNQFWSAARQRCHQFRCRHRETPREIAEERHWLWDTTWAEKNEKMEERRVKNTMGYN